MLKLLPLEKTSLKSKRLQSGTSWRGLHQFKADKTSTITLIVNVGQIKLKWTLSANLSVYGGLFVSLRRSCRDPYGGSGSTQMLDKMDDAEQNSWQYLNKMFKDLGSICWTEVSCQNAGQDLPDPFLRVAAGAQRHGARLLPALTDHQVEFSLRSNSVITQPVPICRSKRVNSSGANSLAYLSAKRFTCKSFSFIKQPLLVRWNIESCKNELFHCGDLLVFSHLDDKYEDM